MSTRRTKKRLQWINYCTSKLQVVTTLYLQAPNRNQASLNTFQLELIGIIKELENLFINMSGANPFIHRLILNKLPEVVQQRVLTESRETYPTVNQILASLDTI